MNNYPSRIKYEPEQRYFSFVLLESIESRISKTGKEYSSWKCKCDCGVIFITTTKQIKRGLKKSCGCLSISNRFKIIDPANAMMKRKLNHYKTSGKRRSIKWELTDEQFYSFLCDNCQYCGSKPILLNKRNNFQIYLNGIDRVDNKKSYSKDNCVTCCYICNRAKGTLTKEVFISWINKIKIHNNEVNIS